MFADIKFYHRPPQYAVPLNTFLRLMPTNAYGYTTPFGSRINISCFDPQTFQKYNFDFSTSTLGAKIWHERCEN